MLSRIGSSPSGLPSVVPISVPNPASLRHWPTCVEAALWLVLLLQLARFAWLLFAPASVAGAPQVSMLPAQTPELAGQDPFFAGTTPAAATTLEGWRLFGVRTAADGRGTGILGRDREPQGVYRTGDELAPGLVLTAVKTGHVEFGNGQRLDLDAGAPPPAASLPATRPAATPSAGAAGFDPAQLLEAGLQARTDAGRITGYTLLPRGNSELLLRAAGLQPGDVLLSVNGQVLSPTVITQLASELKSTRQAIVTFERDGQTRTVNLGSGAP